MNAVMVKESEAVQHLLKWVEEKLQYARERLETEDNDWELKRIQGEIRAYKEVLYLPEEMAVKEKFDAEQQEED